MRIRKKVNTTLKQGGEYSLKYKESKNNLDLIYSEMGKWEVQCVNTEDRFRIFFEFDSERSSPILR